MERLWRAGLAHARIFTIRAHVHRRSFSVQPHLRRQDHQQSLDALNGVVVPEGGKLEGVVDEAKLKNDVPPNRSNGVHPNQEFVSETKTSVDAKESAKFAAMAGTWWDQGGPFKPLHAINPVRLSFIRLALCRHFGRNPSMARPLDGITIVDVGCGGGLLCEPLARMGALVTGIDAVEENTSVARLHAAKDPLTAKIQYRFTTAEQLVQEKQQFDVVTALEVIEHVADPKDFVKSLASLTKQQGAVVISTINRSPTAYGLAIVAAEYILGWLPKGTHDWSKFLTPEELALLMDHASLTVEEMAGMVYNPLTQTWRLADDLSVNYITWGAKRGP